SSESFSIKYLNNNGETYISLKAFGDKITIKVADNGLGILEEELPYIFERFYRGNDSKNNQVKGYGLGLAITKSLVKAHNGSIEVESKVGVGTKFTMVFPF